MPDQEARTIRVRLVEEDEDDVRLPRASDDYRFKIVKLSRD